MNFNPSWQRWPGPNRPGLRVLLFFLFFAAFSVAVISFVEYGKAAATATKVPTDLHTIKVIQGGQTLYFSEAQWRRVHLLLLCSGGFVIVSLLVAASFLVPTLLASLIQSFRNKTPIWDPRISHPPPLPRSKPYRLFGWFSWLDIAIFATIMFLMSLVFLWHFIYWIKAHTGGLR